MFDRTFRIALALAAALAAVAGTGTLAAASGRHIPVMEQREAILDCRYEMGLRGPVRFGAQWPDLPPGGQTVTWILPGRTLTPEQADRINACADERLGRAPTPRFAAQDPRGVAAARAGQGRCPKFAPILYRGSSICIKRR